MILVVSHDILKYICDNLNMHCDNRLSQCIFKLSQMYFNMSCDSSESNKRAPLWCCAIARSDSKSFLTICLIWYSGSLLESEVKLSSDVFRDRNSCFYVLIENDVILVEMRPRCVHFALNILENQKTANIASTDFFSLAYCIFLLKLIFKKV